MEAYQTRIIQFSEQIEIGEWNVKIYTISKSAEFNNPLIYQNAIHQLPNWLKAKNSFDSSHEKIAFLILHSGNRRNVFID